MYLHSNSTMYLSSKKPFGKNYVCLSVCVVFFPMFCEVKIMIIYFGFFWAPCAGRWVRIMSKYNNRPLFFLRITYIFCAVEKMVEHIC